MIQINPIQSIPALSLISSVRAGPAAGSPFRHSLKTLIEIKVGRCVDRYCCNPETFSQESNPIMMLPAYAAAARSRRTALVVMDSTEETTLCPFFGKCDGLLVIDPDAESHEFHANPQHTAEAMCDLILKTGVRRLVLGFIGGPGAQKLRAAGVDIRLGSCACTVEDLALCFDDLPSA